MCHLGSIPFLIAPSTFQPFSLPFNPPTLLPSQGLVTKLEEPRNLMISSESTKFPEENRSSIKSEATPKAVKAKKQRNKKPMKAGIGFGKWNAKEHELFLEAMARYGNSWEKVQKHVGTRTSAQIRSHAQKYYSGLREKAMREYKENNRGEKMLFIVVHEYLNISSFKHPSFHTKNRESLLNS
eukprot:TRINITY_DN966_c0_g1_i8.p1 TRINITY_DN966_c0_g1~~TRINITY_DN966_c0_g1_i8.p1  ORF type:complete len:183 (-),score=26.06 TRINITY_DN966_c0_g1_i8:213-761(-)